MKVKETNTRTGESHIYDTEERAREIQTNHDNKIMGYHSPFRDVQNGDIITFTELPDGEFATDLLTTDKQQENDTI